MIAPYTAEYTRAYTKFNVLGHLPTRGGAQHESLQSPTGKPGGSSASPAAAPKMASRGGASPGKRRPQPTAPGRGTVKDAAAASGSGQMAEIIGEDVDGNATALASILASTPAGGDVFKTSEKGGQVENMTGPSSDQCHGDVGASLGHPSGGGRMEASPNDDIGHSKKPSVRLESLHADDGLAEDDDSQDEDSDDDDYDS